MRRVLQAAVFALVLWAAACASQPRPAPASAATAAPAVARPSVASAGTRAAPAPSELAGTWVEFWAPNGQADTDRYAFFEDGRFVWEAAEGPAAKIARRWGRWKLESAGGGATLLALSIEGHEERFGCEGSANCRVLDAPPEQQRLTLGDCPPNDEAKCLDASYRCIGIGGHAFFHRDVEKKPAPAASAGSVDPAKAAP